MNISNEQLIEQLVVALKASVEALECLANISNSGKGYIASFEKYEDVTEVVEDAFKLAYPLLKTIKKGKL